MKTFIAVLTAILVGSAFYSCKKARTKIEFEVPVTTTYTITAGSLMAWQEYTVTRSAPTNISSKLADHNTNSDLVGDVTCTKLSVELTSPTSGQDLNFINGIRFFIDADLQKEVQQAFRFNTNAYDNTTGMSDTIKPGVKTIDLKLNGPSVKNYIIENAFDFNMRIQPWKTVSSTIVLKMTATYKVRAIE